MPNKRKPRVDLVWTSKLAYAVGLITTDGSLSKDGRHLILTSCDYQLLEIFKECLGLRNRIAINPEGGFKRRQIAYRVQFGNVVMYDWLRRIGLTPNKSLTLGELAINRKYFADFLRGHLDGDGSIIHYIDRYNTKVNDKYVYERVFLIFLSASLRHMHWLSDEIFILTGLRGRVFTVRNNKRESVIYRIKFSTKDARKLLRWIYYEADLPCLKRKYELALPLMDN